MTGWPWPLDGVQDWFEGLWDWIGDAANNAAKWIIDNIYKPFLNWWEQTAGKLWPLTREARTKIDKLIGDLPYWLRGITRFFLQSATVAYGLLKPKFEWLYNTITDGINGLISNVAQLSADAYSWIRDAVADITSSFSSLINQAKNTLTNTVSNVQTTLSSAIGELGNTLGQTLTNLSNTVSSGLETTLTTIQNIGGTLTEQISNGATWTYNQLKTAFDGALGTVSETLTSIFTDPSGLFGGAISWFTSSFGFVDMADVSAQTLNLMQRIGESFTHLATLHSPITPEEALTATTGWRWEQRDYWYQLYISALAIEGASLGQVDGPTSMLMDEPMTKASMDLATEWFKLEYDVGYTTALRYMWNKVYTPMIPSASDLVRMVVREAFVPEMITPAPDEFAKWMEYQGFSRYWADKFWTAHWVPAPLTDARTAVYRGLITEEDYIDLLRIHDFHPKYREWMAQTIYRTLRLIDIRRGWELGVLSDEDLEWELHRYGYAPEDIPKVAAVHKAIALEAEINALRTEAINDYVEGLIDAETLKTRLKQAGTPETLLPYHLAKAHYKMRRDLLLEQIKLLRDQAIRGIITTTQLEEELRYLGVADWKIEQIKEYVEMRRKNDPDVIRTLTTTQVLRAYREGIRDRSWAEQRLIDMNYPEDDREVLLALYAPEQKTMEGEAG